MVHRIAVTGTVWLLMASAASVARAQTASPVPAVRRDTLPSPAQNQLSFSSAIVSRADNNVNRDDANVRSVGGAAAVGARFESSTLRPGLVLEYDAALHRYTGTTRFNRVSQRLRSTLSSRIARWWTVELIGEGALKGSSEDRDVSDQLMLLPRTDFRLTGASRLRLGASQRWRRYPTDSLQNAVNRYVFAEVRHRLGRDAAIETQARLERNDAAGARFDYRRSMLASTFSTPVGAHVAFELGMQYRIQEYSGRFVKINKLDQRRVDHRLEPSALLALRLGASEVALSYDPEWRRSNDPGKIMDQQILQLSVRRRW
jgi:hypothetical protein